MQEEYRIKFNELKKKMIYINKKLMNVKEN